MKRGFNLKFSKRNKEAKAKTEMQFVYNIPLSFFARKILKNKFSQRNKDAKAKSRI